MKKMLVLSITLILGLATSSWAAEERAMNPGIDPNEAKISRPYEAEVAAPGTCPECLARMKHGRLKDDTTFRDNGSGQGADKKEGDQQGTK